MPTAAEVKHFPRARLARPHDGDTFWLLVDLGFNITATVDFRLLGLDADELKLPSGKEVAAYVLTWLTGSTLEQWPLSVDSYKTEKYGRWLARVSRADGTCLNDDLIAKGYARPYDGGKR